jgi:hypothetical protein
MTAPACTVSGLGDAGAHRRTASRGSRRSAYSPEHTSTIRRQPLGVIGSIDP